MQAETPPNIDCSVCGKHCTSSGGLARHIKAIHRSLNLPEDSTKYVRTRHPYLSGKFFIFIVDYNSG